MQNKISLKKQMIRTLDSFLTSDVLEGNKLILITAGGTIYGTPVLNSDDINKLPLTAFSEQINKLYQEKYELADDYIAPENDGYLCLKDVCVRNGNTKSFFPEMNVFFDQVIAVSFGNPSE